MSVKCCACTREYSLVQRKIVRPLQRLLIKLVHKNCVHKTVSDIKGCCNLPFHLPFHLQQQCRSKLCCSLQWEQEQKTSRIAEVIQMSPVITTDTSELIGLALRKLMLEFLKCWAWLDCLALEITELELELL